MQAVDLVRPRNSAARERKLRQCEITVRGDGTPGTIAKARYAVSLPEKGKSSIARLRDMYFGKETRPDSTNMASR